MTLPELEACLDHLGVRLSAREDRLHYQAPKGVMTPELKAWLVIHKAALLARLASPPGPYSCDSEGVISRDRPRPAGPPEADLARRSAYWVAPDLTADELDALDEIVAVPPGAPWPALGGLMEEGRRHNAAVLARKGRR